MDDLFATFDPATATHEQLVALILEMTRRFQALEVENRRLREEQEQLRAENQQLREELKRRGGIPPWVKPNTQKPNPKLAAQKANNEQKKERKKRAQSFVRKRETPTEIIYHAQSHCPDCQRTLAGGWEHTRRQVIEIPQAPVRIIDHVTIARHCGVCDKRCLPKVDLSQEVVGQHRMGIKLMSLIGLLRISCRLPIRTIRSLLQTLYGLCISNGEIVEALHRIARKAESWRRCTGSPEKQNRGGAAPDRPKSRARGGNAQGADPRQPLLPRR